MVTGTLMAFAGFTRSRNWKKWSTSGPCSRSSSFAPPSDPASQAAGGCGPFRCPSFYIVAPVGIAVNLLLMLLPPLLTWVRLFAWLGIGMSIYFAYGYYNSVMRRGRRIDGASKPRR